jgi:hypothetical protein
MNEILEAYLTFLWQQFQYDWSWMSNPWVLYPIVPVILYVFFFFCKWTVLLAPVTVPIMLIRWPVGNGVKNVNKENKNNYINN